MARARVFHSAVFHLFGVGLLLKLKLKMEDILAENCIGKLKAMAKPSVDPLMIPLMTFYQSRSIFLRAAFISDSRDPFISITHFKIMHNVNFPILIFCFYYSGAAFLLRCSATTTAPAMAYRIAAAERAHTHHPTNQHP